MPKQRPETDWLFKDRLYFCTVYFFPCIPPFRCTLLLLVSGQGIYTMCRLSCGGAR